MDANKLIDILGNFIERLTTTNAVLFIMLIASWVGFFFVTKVLWNAYNNSQNLRIEENRNMIKIQESTTSALNSLTRVVEVGFGVRQTTGRKK